MQRNVGLSSPGDVRSRGRCRGGTLPTVHIQGSVKARPLRLGSEKRAIVHSQNACLRLVCTGLPSSSEGIACLDCNALVFDATLGRFASCVASKRARFAPTYSNREVAHPRPHWRRLPSQVGRDATRGKRRGYDPRRRARCTIWTPPFVLGMRGSSTAVGGGGFREGVPSRVPPLPRIRTRLRGRWSVSKLPSLRSYEVRGVWTCRSTSKTVCPSPWEAIGWVWVWGGSFHPGSKVPSTRTRSGSTRFPIPFQPGFLPPVWGEGNV